MAGFESPGEWDEHHTVFGVDGADVQYAVSLYVVLSSIFSGFPFFTTFSLKF